MQTRWQIFDSESDWLNAALHWVGRAAAEAISARGVFHIVLAGGGTPEKLYAALAGQPQDWTHWQVWFGDERCLPPDHPERNSRMAWRSLLGKVPIPGTNIHTIAAELGALSAAEGYAECLHGIGLFDLVLLGLGEDGHTASLFPGQDWGEEPNAEVLAVFAAPKPPPERVSLSARRLGEARQVLFLVGGAGKRAALSAWQAGEPIPAAAIRPPSGVDVLMTRDAIPLVE